MKTPKELAIEYYKKLDEMASRKRDHYKKKRGNKQLK